MDLSDPKDVIEIIEDNHSGSTEVSKKIEDFFSSVPADKFSEVVLKILYAHSSMASVINKVNWLCLRREGVFIDPPSDKWKMVQSVFWEEYLEKSRWVTLSNSTWVYRLLANSPIKLDLTIGVSYPDCEGLLLANKLSDYHNINVVEDMDLCSMVQTSDGVILGADLIETAYFINKIGSFALGLSAGYFKKPLLVIGAGDKFLSEELKVFFKTKETKEGNRIIRCFEQIPKSLVTNFYLATDPWELPLSNHLKKISSGWK